MAAALRAWGGGTITNGYWKRFQHQMDSLSQTRVLPNRLVSSWILTSHQPHWVTSVRIAEEIHNNNKTSTQRSGFKIWIFPVDFTLNLKTEEIRE